MSRKNMSRRRLLKLMGLGAAGTTLAACQPKVVEKVVKETVVVKEKETVVVEEKVEVEVEKEVTRVVEKQVKADEDVVVLKMHMRAGGEKSEWPMYKSRREEFNDAHPGIRCELAPLPGGEYYAKVQTMAAAKTLGDIMWTADVWTDHSRLVKLGVLASCDDYLDKTGISKDEWLDSCVATLTHDGKMYGLPKCSHPGDAYVWINQDLFKEAGLPIPETYGNSLQDITSWAEKLAQGPENDRSVYGYMPCVSHIMALFNPARQFGAIENNEAGTESRYDEAEWYEWAKWTQDFYKRNLATVEATLPSGGITALFSSGRLAMMHRQRYMYKRVRQAVEELGRPFTWKVIQLPRGPNARGWVACVDTHTVTASTEHPEEAHMMEYAMADQRFTELVAKNIGYLGGRKDDIDTIQDFKYPFLELQYKCMTQEEKFYQPENARGREVQTVLTNTLDKIWLGEEELSEGFMDRLKSDVDQILAKPF